MAYKVVWTRKAIDGYDAIVDYLELNWTDREIRTFIEETERVLGLLSLNPEIFQRSTEHKTLHRGLFNKLTFFTYRIKTGKKEIQIINVRATRRKLLR